MKKSKGHIDFIGDREWYVQEGNVYAAPTYCPLDLEGYRQGGRWQCYDREPDKSRRVNEAKNWKG